MTIGGRKMTRLKYTIVAGLVGIPFAGLIALISGGDGRRALIEFVACIAVFMLCGAFAKKAWVEVTTDFFRRSLDLW